ncbi:condensation domain-containing protein [Streptomyces sp. NPDC052701]|uniref:condensation domain-containing protein n=1 Tax=Streptomyces sp. NPDC052701 TaxID=3155533 RepID=UPI003433F37B
MKMTELDDYLVRPGQVREWTLHPSVISAAHQVERDPTPPSYNQESHILTMARLEERGARTADWAGVAFELPGELDVKAFGRALVDWMGWHETLRSGFRRSGGEMHRFTLPREAIEVSSAVLGDFRDAATMSRFLRDRLDAGTHTLRWPSFVVETVQRTGSVTVVLAFDHMHFDGYTLFGMVQEVREFYLAALEGRNPLVAAAGSHVGYCDVERREALLVGREHPAVLRWERFIADSGGRPPGFPLPLGAREEELLPQKSVFDWLLDPAETDAFTEVCHAEQTILPSGVLAAVALAVRELGVAGPYRTVMPFHTRSRPEWASSVGWFVGVGPVEVDLPPGCDFRSALPLAQHAAREARQVARVPFFRVSELLGVDFRQDAPDPFSLLSYMDLRHLPGARGWARWNARLLTRISNSSKACLWVMCSPEGLYLFARHPDTGLAAANIARFVGAVRDIVQCVARTGNFTSAMLHQVPSPA